MTQGNSLPSVAPIDTRGYAHPEVLVSTAWVAEHLNDPSVRLIESNEDLLLYETGHVPGAVKIDWTNDLNDPLVRDYVSRDAFESLLRAKGISGNTTIVFYGDKNNWWATYAFWVFRLFGPVSYTHLRAHETPEHLVCRLLLEKKKKKNSKERICYNM